MTPWEVLGLDPATSDRRDVQRAYARLVKEHRPDRDPVRFQEIREAYRRALAELEHAKLEGRAADPSAGAAETGSDAEPGGDGEVRGPASPGPGSNLEPDVEPDVEPSVEPGVEPDESTAIADLAGGPGWIAYRWTVASARAGRWDDVGALLEPYSDGSASISPGSAPALAMSLQHAALAWPWIASRIASRVFPDLDEAGRDVLSRVEARIAVGRELERLDRDLHLTVARVFELEEDADPADPDVRRAVREIWSERWDGELELTRRVLRGAFPEWTFPVRARKDREKSGPRRGFNYGLIAVPFLVLLLSRCLQQVVRDLQGSAPAPRYVREQRVREAEAELDAIAARSAEMEAQNRYQGELPASYDGSPWMIEIRRALGVRPDVCAARLVPLIGGRAEVPRDDPRLVTVMQVLLGDETLPLEARLALPRVIASEWPSLAAELLTPYVESDGAFGDGVRLALWRLASSSNGAADDG